MRFHSYKLKMKHKTGCLQYELIWYNMNKMTSEEPVCRLHRSEEGPCRSQGGPLSVKEGLLSTWGGPLLVFGGPFLVSGWTHVDLRRAPGGLKRSSVGLRRTPAGLREGVCLRERAPLTLLVAGSWLLLLVAGGLFRTPLEISGSYRSIFKIQTTSVSPQHDLHF